MLPERRERHKERLHWSFTEGFVCIPVEKFFMVLMQAHYKHIVLFFRLFTFLNEALQGIHNQRGWCWSLWSTLDLESLQTFRKRLIWTGVLRSSISTGCSLTGFFFLNSWSRITPNIPFSLYIISQDYNLLLSCFGGEKHFFSLCDMNMGLKSSWRGSC